MVSIFIILLEALTLSTQAKVLSGRFLKNYATLRHDLSKKEVARIKAGHSLFSKPWVQAPSSTELRNGLGPHFNAISCISCHPGFGRGAPPQTIHANDPALLFKVKGPPSPYGKQIQPHSIITLKSEAKVSIHYQIIQSDLPGVTLTMPHYELINMKFGPLGKDQFLSPRIAPSLAGLGYLNKIPSEEIIKNQSNGGITHIIGGKLGRFGWKADKVDLRHQVAAAFQSDLGITNSIFPNQPCSGEQVDCLSAPTGVEPHNNYEIEDKHLDYVVELMAAIAPPKRQIDPSKITSIHRGEEIFKKINCHSCHRQSYQLDEGLSIEPFTDLLMHDMGEALSDRGNSYDSRLWRTAPLWGLGSQSLVNSHMRLLHDGRASGLTQAILWHDGEAKKAKHSFVKLSASDKAHLLQFLSSL